MSWFLQMPQGPAVFLSNEEMSLVNKVKDEWIKKSELDEREQTLAFNLVSRGIISKKLMENEMTYKYLGKFPGFKQPAQQISELKNRLDELHNGDDGFNGSLTDDPKELGEGFDETKYELEQLIPEIDDAIEHLTTIKDLIDSNMYDSEYYQELLMALQQFADQTLPKLLKN
jgi:NurA-like 5'-3' nuclease